MSEVATEGVTLMAENSMVDPVVDVDVFREFDLFENFVGKRLMPRRRTPDLNFNYHAEISSKSFGPLNIVTIESTPYIIEIDDEVLSLPTSQQYYSINICNKGLYKIQQESEIRYIIPDSIFVINTELKSIITSKDRASSTVVAIPRDIWHYHAPPPSLGGQHFLEKGKLQTKILLNMAREIMFAPLYVDDAYKNIIVRQFIELASISVNPFNGNKSNTINKSLHMRNIKNYIGVNLTNNKLNFSELSEHFNISPRYISKLFNDDGLTFNDYVQNLRLKRASELIMCRDNSVLSIKEICYRVGFINPSHFSRKFAEKFGVSPKLYRKSKVTR